MPTATGAPDTANIGDLVRNVKSGDERSFDRLVHLFAERVYRFLMVRGLSSHDAEDITQESFMKAYDAIKDYDEKYAFSTWLFTIAKRQAVSHQRKQKHHVPLENLPDLPEKESQEEGSNLEGLWEFVRNNLNESHFDVLWLKYGEGMSLGDIAEVMNISQVNSRVLIHRAREKLAKLLPKSKEDAASTLAMTKEC
ncbi:MAG: RNA polymerase sigma factor [Planctomycetes bacterium]|nr:RNA polymerase sigma factor [Planctomycetota bacterium]